MAINYGQGFNEAGNRMNIDSITDAMGRNVFGSAGGDPYTFDPYSFTLPAEYAGYMRVGADPAQLMNTGSFYPQAGFNPSMAKYDPTYGYLIPKEVMDRRAGLLAQSGALPGAKSDFMSTYGPALVGALVGGGVAMGAGGLGGAGAGAAGALPESYWSMLASNGAGGTMADAGLGSLFGSSGAFEGIGAGAGALGGAGSLAGAGGAAGGSGGGLSSLLGSIGNYLSNPSAMNILGSVISGVANASGSSSAANAQQNAANQANATTLGMYQQNRADMEPWRQTGVGALNRLATLMGIPGGNGVAASGDPAFGSLTKNFGMSDFQADPGYNFRLSEGLKALQNSAAAKGSLMSGSTMKGLERFGQNLASDEYTNAFNRYQTQNNNLYNRLAGLSGTGQVQSQQMAAQGANAANSLGQNIIGAGNAQAAGMVGRSNALSGAIGQGMNFYNNNRLLDILQGRNSGGLQSWNAPAFGGYDPWSDIGSDYGTGGGNIYNLSGMEMGY